MVGGVYQRGMEGAGSIRFSEYLDRPFVVFVRIILFSFYRVIRSSIYDTRFLLNIGFFLFQRTIFIVFSFSTSHGSDGHLLNLYSFDRPTTGRYRWAFLLTPLLLALSSAIFPQAGCPVILNILRKQRFAVGNDSAYRVGRTNTALSTP